MGLGRDLARRGQRAGRVVARVAFANMARKRADLAVGIAFRRREQGRCLSVRYLVGAVDRALPLLGKNPGRLLYELKVIVGAFVVGQRAVVGLRSAEDRRSAGPAADQLRAEKLA